MLGGRATLNTINTTGNNNGNNNNRLFMVPHFIQALTKTKHNYVHITHTHTTNTCITGHGLVCWEENNRSVCRREKWVISLDLKEE